MITGIIISLILAATGISFLAAYFWKRASEQREELDSLQDSQIESPASESPKKVDWEPDDYKDLSDGTTGKIEKVFKENNFKDGASPKHRRFDDDELSEVSHMLQDHELREYGG